MYRLPYRAMCSRETNRLPVTEIQKKLGNNIPNIENGRAASEELTDPKYFVYYGYPHEFGVIDQSNPFYGNRFMLVEVNGLKETILDKGEADGISRHSGRGYIKFYGRGQRTGLFSYYCTSPEAM